MKGKIEISYLTIEEIARMFKEMGHPAYRANQVYKWMCLGETDFNNMTDLPKDFREKLKESFIFGKLKIIQKLQSNIDNTVKYIFSTDDGNIIESVFMKYSFGNTVCISTQVGCKMGCVFCASTNVPFGRNLTPGEMLLQVTMIQDDIAEKINNIVMMGIGEPLDNYDNVIKLAKNLHFENGLNVGYRRITISTCGIVPGIENLIKEKIPVNLSVSLHSPYNHERDNMMPINKVYPIDNLISVCNIYTKETMRRITFEYTLIDHVNDSQQHALDLAKLIKGMLCHVNIIPLNIVGDIKMGKSSIDRIERFKAKLDSKGIEATIRRELGSDIKAACGQLRSNIVKQVQGDIGKEG